MDGTLEVRRRGSWGKFFKWLFIIFNILMAIYFASSYIQPLSSYNNQPALGKLFYNVKAMKHNFELINLWLNGILLLGLFAFFSRGKKIKVLLWQPDMEMQPTKTAMFGK